MEIAFNDFVKRLQETQYQTHLGTLIPESFAEALPITGASTQDGRLVLHTDSGDIVVNPVDVDDVYEDDSGSICVMGHKPPDVDGKSSRTPVLLQIDNSAVVAEKRRGREEEEARWRHERAVRIIAFKGAFVGKAVHDILFQKDSVTLEFTDGTRLEIGNRSGDVEDRDIFCFDGHPVSDLCPR